MDNLFRVSDSTSIQVKRVPIGQSLWFIGIIVIILIAALAYWYFKPRAKDATALGPYVLKGASMIQSDENTVVTVFNQSQIDDALGNNFTFGFFVYMDDANRERIPIAGPKGDFRFKTFINILGIGDIVLDPIHQMARLNFKPLTRNTGSLPGATIDIENFMISRWNQLLFTVEGRTVDVYLNGALASSTLLENLPLLNPVGVLLETSPDFSGQAGLFQAWPRRLTTSQVGANYKRNTDTRGKPLIPDVGPKFTDIFKQIPRSLCDLGFCGFRFSVGPMEYIDYEFA
jgi:hypothetical protein